jgi:hypothetical protein
MNLFDLTPQQLKRAASIKEQIEELNKELGRILGVRRDPGNGSARVQTDSKRISERAGTKSFSARASADRSRQLRTSVSVR